MRPRIGLVRKLVQKKTRIYCGEVEADLGLRESYLSQDPCRLAYESLGKS